MSGPHLDNALLAVVHIRVKILDVLQFPLESHESGVLPGLAHDVRRLEALRSRPGRDHVPALALHVI